MKYSCNYMFYYYLTLKTSFILIYTTYMTCEYFDV